MQSRRAKRQPARSADRRHHGSTKPSDEGETAKPSGVAAAPAAAPAAVSEEKVEDAGEHVSRKDVKQAQADAAAAKGDQAPVETEE